ncbi:hypothetical protein [Duganella sp. HH105]|uniref:hypothetical protein n=1 Tax=Duganella sp. HH105 TaxID=1781067 RepID=UPI00114D23C9|nr:hypothetical protein [Duganella sp. HH105]
MRTFTVTLFLAGTFVKGFPGVRAPACLKAYLCTEKYFSSSLESVSSLNFTCRKYLILLGKKFACGLGILLKPAPLKAFSGVKWRLFTTLSTVGVDICEKRFKSTCLAAFLQELQQRASSLSVNSIEPHQLCLHDNISADNFFTWRRSSTCPRSTSFEARNRMRTSLCVAWGRNAWLRNQEIDRDFTDL